MAQKWWAAWNQDWPYYLTVLQSNYAPDGLELWCACVMTDTHITLVQRGHVWSSRASGPCDNDYTIMWLDTGAVYCNIHLDEADLVTSEEDFEQASAGQAVGILLTL